MSELVVKDNVLINASYNLELVEQRLILLAIIEARESGKGINANDPLTVHADNYITQFDVHRTTAYQALKDACDDLFVRQFSYQEINQRGNIEKIRSRWVSEIRYIDNEAVVKLIFAPAVVPLITSLEKQFTKYEIEQISHLSSAYAVRLYELLICWRSTGKTEKIDLYELRKRLGVVDGEYKLMADFKKRIIDKAISQVNEHTDITVSYEQHKAGRTITGFSFTFKSKKAPEPKAKPEKASKTRLEPLMPMSQDKLAAEFTALPVEEQEAVINRIKSKLKGVKLAQFNTALSAYRSTQSKALFQEYEAIFSQALEAFASAKA